MDWDILIKGGDVIDPSQGLHGRANVGILGEKISAVGPSVDGDAQVVIDARDKIVTAGFVDLHTHNYTSNSKLHSLDADSTSLANGATTVLDAGTATPSEFPHYWETDLSEAKTRIYALIRMPMPYGPDPATVEQAAAVIKQYEDVLIGMKYHHSQHYVTLPLAREASDFGGGILMAEAYGAPIPQLLDYMNPGDIVTHTFHASFRYPLWDHRGEVWPAVWDAVDRGVYLDIGHGARGFSWRTMEHALIKGLRPSTISTDLHAGNVDGPTYDMPTTMSKMLALGLSLDEVVEMSTSIPAKALRQQDFIGTLKPGAQADVVVSELLEGEYKYLDVLHETRIGKQRIFPHTVIFGGQMYDGPRYEPTDMSHQHDAPPGFIEGT